MTDRFEVTTNMVGKVVVYDNVEKKYYHYDNILDFFALIRILNELNSKVNE